MATIDIFSQDAFGVVEMSNALVKTPYKPQRLGQLGIFTPKPIRTARFSIEKTDGKLQLVPTSLRGAPMPQRQRDGRDIRDFRTVRIAKADALTADEIQGIRAFGSESELMQVQAEVMARMAALRDDIDLTMEFHRLGAVQGIVLDADGTTVIYNWFTEWGVAAPSEVDFTLGTYGDGSIRTKCTQIIRAMQRASKGAWTPGTHVHALVGDTFFDKLVANKEVRETYLNQVGAAELRTGFENPGSRVVTYGGITFENYVGTDDNSTVAIPLTKAKFFPVGARGVFEVAFSPGESFEHVNTPGQPFYARTIPDRDRNSKVEIEVASYPMHYCTRPEMLQAGTTSN
jgi:hypothetical protein